MAVGVLIITHGATGAALLAAAGHVLGASQSGVRTIDVEPGDDPSAVEAGARRDLAAIDDGSGVIVFTDVYGATPSNVAGRLIEPGHVEAVAGVNLPMLIRALAYRALPIEQVLSRALEAGRRGQIDMKEDPCHAAAGRS
jgi:PTS system ascorbate-specific IIA component